MMPRPFLLVVFPRSIDSGELDRSFPPHRLVIAPLLSVASEVRVHGYPEAGPDVPPLPPTVPAGPGNIILDRSRELLRGHEAFWNASGWARGSISLRMSLASVDWAHLFSWVEYGGTASKTGLRKSTPTRAISYADREAHGPNVVVTFSASNGLGWADVWAPPERCEELDALAQATCRRFVRWVEHGKYEREIIYDRPPYTDFAKD